MIISPGVFVALISVAVAIGFDPPPMIMMMMYLFLVCVCSFAPDCHLVVDARVMLSVQPIASTGQDNITQEVLYPARHQMTLPLNQLNFMFNDFSVSANHHTRLDSDR